LLFARQSKVRIDKTYMPSANATPADGSTSIIIVAAVSGVAPRSSPLKPTPYILNPEP
jgi:hypothetical protein